MKIPPEKLTDISEANDIVDLIASYTPVKKRGKSFLALCPFHPDKNPSLTISREKQVYHCFSCGAGGNVFTFVQNHEKVTFFEAAEKLAKRAGIDLNIKKLSPDVSNEISRLFEINKKAARFFNNNLTNLAGSERDFIFAYLDKRKINIQTVTKFGIGYANKEWNSLLNFFLEDNIFSTEDVEKAGLIKKSESEKNRYYDRFRGRLIFPIFSDNDKVIGFGGRKLYEDDLGAKYINSPETKIYNKSKVLYGLNFAKESLRILDYAILVEGYMDLISLAQAGIQNVVASSGTALTEQQVQLISRYTNNVVIIYDADLAGIKAAKRGIEIFLEAGIEINAIALPDGEDPDSFVRSYGKDKFLKFVDEKQSIVNFIASLYDKENKLSTVNDKTEFVKEIINYISRIPDKIKRSFYLKEICERYELREADLLDELESSVSRNKKYYSAKSSVIIPQRKKIRSNEKSKDLTRIEEELISLIIKGSDETVEHLENNLNFEYLESKMASDIVLLFWNDYMEFGNIDVTRAMNNTDNQEIISFISALSNRKYELSEYEKISKDHILAAKAVRKGSELKSAKQVLLRLESEHLKRERDSLPKSEENFEKVIELSKQITDIDKKIKALAY